MMFLHDIFEFHKIGRMAQTTKKDTTVFIESTGRFGSTGENEIDLEIEIEDFRSHQISFFLTAQDVRSRLGCPAFPDLFLKFFSLLKMMKLNKLSLWSIWSLKLKTAKFTEITNMSTELNFFISTSLITFNNRALAQAFHAFKP